MFAVMYDRRFVEDRKELLLGIETGEATPSAKYAVPLAIAVIVLLLIILS